MEITPQAVALPKSTDDLPKGKYILAYGANVNSNGGANFALLSPQVNSIAPSDNDRAGASGTNQISVSRLAAFDLAEDVNTVTLKYRVDSGTGTFRNRWLIALKFANL